MHGENCAIPGCSISRKDKISIFKVFLHRITVKEGGGLGTGEQVFMVFY